MRQLGLKRKALIPPSVRTILLLTTIIFFLTITMTVWVIDRSITPHLMDIAEEKTIEFATRAINEAVKSTEDMTFEDFIDIQTDQYGNITSVGWNSSAVNHALRTVTERAEYFLYGMNVGQPLDPDDPNIEQFDFDGSVRELPLRDPTVVEIPLGQVTGSTLLANLGPRIPVHFEIIGSIQSDVIHNIREFGINATLVELYIPITAQIQVIIPFSTSVKEISTHVYLDSRVIMGDVPDFYNRGGDGGPTISVPRDSFRDNN